MAKTNQITLYAGVISLPRVNTNKTSATSVVMVMRGDRESGDPNKQIRKDYPIIVSKDPEIIAKMQEWDERDIVMIKGVIVTRSIMKSSICPHCRKENIVKGTLVYVEPIYVEKLGHVDNDGELNQTIYEHREISNNLRIIGDLCFDPEKLDFKKGYACQYQIAVPRTYRVKGSTDDDKTDFPFVKSYGKNAKEDLKRLKKGSQVLIDGYIQTRRIEKEVECEQTLSNGEICNNKYKWQDSAMEIVPFETEYLKGYVTDEDLGIIKDFSKEIPEESAV